MSKGKSIKNPGEKLVSTSKGSGSDGIDVRVRFCLLFCLGLATLMGIFLQWKPWFSDLYLWPISWTAASLIDLFGATVAAYDPVDQHEFTVIEIGRFVFHVEHQCSGISAFFIYLAALVAYPADWEHKIRGALIGLPAFFAYGTLRLVILGGIALTIPDLLQFFHLYFMVILNLGFVMMLWTDWIRRVSETADASSVDKGA
jgi:exosortase/archaeosortase family protein